MKPSGYFLLGVLLTVLLFVPAMFFAALLYDFNFSGMDFFYQIFQIITTITCTGIIINKIDKSKED